MKVAAIVFLSLGLAARFFLDPINNLFGLVFVALGIAFGIVAIVDLAKGRKRTWVGVVALIFTGLVGGILYLCWDPNKN